MQEIDASIDDHPELALELIDMDIRNKQAHAELQSYNDNHLFIYKHPFLTEQRNYNTTLTELYDLKKNNPEAFVKECYSITRNIQRYKKQLDSKTITDHEEIQRTIDNLNRYTLRNQIASKLLTE